MLWTTSRTPLDLIPVFLFTTAALVWWSAKPKNLRLNLVAAVGVLLFCLAVAPELSLEVPAWIYVSAVNATIASRLDLVVLPFVAKHWNMLLTGAAIVWLGRRAIQTLLKPVSELINILGVEVPETPDVTLAGIRADAATINWSRSAPNRPVQKFLIQVNGVNVGEVGANQEPAIVVTGLKPDHFYNIRVIAVGPNNFQAGSKLVRLRTLGRDGRPQLGNGQLPSNFRDDELGAMGQGEHGQETGGVRNPLPGLETAAGPDGIPLTREGSVSGPATRRNTVTRRHSPSIASMEAPTSREDTSRQPEQSLPELTNKFESIRTEIEDTVSLIAKEESDNEKLMKELEAEKAEKKREKEKKETQTDALKKEVNSTDREMRKAQATRTALEKRVKEKKDSRKKLSESIENYQRLKREMGEEMAGFGEQRGELEKERDQKAECLRQSNQSLQDECSQMEVELKEKRERVKELEDARKKLPGGDDDSGSRNEEAEYRREWQTTSRGWQETVYQHQRLAKGLDEQIRVLGSQVQAIPPANYGMYSQANSSGLDLENAALNQLKRRSRTSNSLSNVSISSPLPAYSQIDPATLPAPPAGFSSGRGATGSGVFPFLDFSEMPPAVDDAGFKVATAPLSPSATALVPSNILDDFDDFTPDPATQTLLDPFAIQQGGTPDDGPQSPSSSARSVGMLASPHESTQSLHRQVPQGENPDHVSPDAPGTMSSPAAGEASTNRLAHLFSFQRGRAPKGVDDAGPTLGSLKHGQSQSFPRQTDEAEVAKKKWTVFNRSSAGPDLMENTVTNSRAFRNLIPFTSHRPNSMFSERNPSSPRPASIASSEFPRPSTDSGSIWAPLDTSSNRFWSPEAWSRDPSRRPSLHGSPSALKTTLASENDEILKEESLPDVSQVGVIGSRPPTAKPLGKLNPTASPFMSIFKSKPDKDKDEKEVGKDKDKSKAKDKKAKDSKDKSKLKENTKPDTPRASVEVESPSDSRQSRDTMSVHTQTSVSESRESLTLDQPLSNTPSEPLSAALSSSAKDENVVRKLFRKGSSGKFSLPGRLGGKDSGLFKKGPSSVASTTNSDRAISVERSSIGDIEPPLGTAGLPAEEASTSMFTRSHDSVTSSPSLGPIVSNSAAASNNGSVKGKEGKTSVRWLSTLSKKGRKEKESLDLDRDKILELETSVAE